MIKSLIVFLINPGFKICEFFNVKNDNKTILRTFINLTWYSHWGAWVTLIYVTRYPI